MKHLSGTHHDIGRQIGTYYKSCGVSFAPVTEAAILDRQITFYEKHAPEILDELQGITQGGGYDFNAVAHAFLVGEILFLRTRAQRSCSIGGFTDSSGHVWVVRNYDWHPAVSKAFQTWKFSFSGKEVLAISDMGIIDSGGIDKSKQLFLYEDAINGDGLYIGMTFAYRWVDAIGLTSFDAVRLVAWRCQSVAEAVRLFETIPLASPKNFFIADKTGKMAVIQHGVDKFDVRYPNEEGLLALTNHYVGRLDADDQVRKANPNHSTFNRYAQLMGDMRKTARSASVDFNKLDILMTSPSTPVCQCIRDTKTSQVQMETVWTLLLAPLQQRYRLIGNPRSKDRTSMDIVV